MKRKFFVVFLMLCMCILPAYAQPEAPQLYSNNLNDQNYSAYGSPVWSYLTPQSNGYMLTAWNNSDNQLHVAYYDDSYNMLSEKVIAAELPIFGGFYAADDAYYVVSGQSNPDESDSVEVFRITKYDLNWKRLGSTGLYGANTYIPFDAGSCRMDYSAPYLVIRTCHEMYKSSDGYHHQANVTIQVDTNQMAVTDAYYDVMNISYGYVSHSFNEFVLIDDDHIVSVDHGDAYPRSAVLFKYNANVSSGTFQQGWGYGTYATLMRFVGEIGNNTTNASVGGFVKSSSHYLTAGNASDQSEYGNRTRNIWVVSSSRNDINETNTYWLTSMPEDGSNHLTTPHLVNLPDDRELALWADVGYDYDTFAKENNLYYQFLDHTGKPVGTVYSNKGNLSDCVPVVKGNKLVWYVHEENFVTFYEIDLGSGKLTKTLSRTNGWKDVESVNFSQDEILVTVGYRGELNTILLPEDATDTRVSVTSQNETVASYNVSSYYGNYVYGESEGETVIQATTPSGKKAECKVKVITPFEDYSIDYAPSRMYVSQTFDLNVSVTPEDHMKYVKYESSDPSVLSVSDKGVLTALKPGTSQIKVRCGSQTLSSRTIEVYRVDPESIKFDSNEATMVKGDSKNINATLTPNDAVKTLTWKSSNASVATVDDKGLVKALKAGKTTITATTVNGLSATCDVTVVDKEVKATGITLDKSELFVTRGYHDNLVATIMPENTTYKDVVWESSDENTVTVNNGNVYGRNYGTATITATTNNGLQAKCKVEVVEGVYSWGYSPLPTWMHVSQVYKIDVSVSPEEAQKYVTFESSDPSVISVTSDGTLTALKVGESTVSVKCGSQVLLSETIEVYEIEPETIRLNKTTLSLVEGESETLTATITPSDATDKSVTWSSSDTSVATVSNGKVTAVKAGSATITAKTSNNKTATCTVTVTKKMVAATGITLNKTSLSLVEGASETLTATVTPSDAMDKSVTWTSSDTSVATVSNGKVTAVKVGNATISATSINGLVATCNVTVTAVDIEIEATSIVLNKTELVMTQGYHENLVATIMPENTTNKIIAWESSDENVAIVENGDVFGNGIGTTMITATTSNGLQAQCKVEVIGYVSLEPAPIPYRMYVSQKIEDYFAVVPNEYQKYVTYESSDPSVISVTNGTILTALKVGEATVIVKCGSQELVTMRIEVIELPPERISLNYNQIVLQVGESKQLQADVFPDNSHQTVRWQSSDQTIATVDGNGNVTGRSVGTATIVATTSNGLTAMCVVNVTKEQTACRVFGFCEYNGKKYWYENGMRQGVYGDPKNITDELFNIERGREIFDPESDGWYWLDAVYDGAAAFGKEVWMPYIYQDEDKWDDATIRKNANNADEGMKDYVYECMKNKTGKWVRYDENGKMLKGWVEIKDELAEVYPYQKGNVYYYDKFTGLMAKGWLTIEGELHHFDEITGVLIQ